MNTRQELLACVRNLPRHSGKTIASDVWTGFQVYWKGPVLARVQNTGGHDLFYEPPVNFDLCLRYISRQKLLEFAPDDSHMMSRLNTELSGSRQYPLITGACGTFANVTHEAIQTAISAYQTTRPTQVQAHERNELWAIELVGRQGQDLQHVLYLWLVDPLREGPAGQGGYHAWLAHEIRHDLVAPIPEQPRAYRLPTRGRRVEDLLPLHAMTLPIPNIALEAVAYRTV